MKPSKGQFTLWIFVAVYLIVVTLGLIAFSLYWILEHGYGLALVVGVCLIGIMVVTAKMRQGEAK